MKTKPKDMLHVPTAELHSLFALEVSFGGERTFSEGVPPAVVAAGRRGRRWPRGGGPGVWAAKTVKRPPQQPAQPPVRQLLGAADAHTAHPAASRTAPAHQRLGSANAETTPAGAPAAAAGRTQRPDATCEGTSG